MYLPFFSFRPFFSVQFLTVLTALCFLDWSLMIVSIIGKLSCKYNPSRILNVSCMKSKNIQLHFIASSFWTSMWYLSRLRAIIYFSNNSSLLEILMHGTPISNGLIFFKGEGHIRFSYFTSAKQYGSLTCVKYKKTFLCLQQLEWE